MSLCMSANTVQVLKLDPMLTVRFFILQMICHQMQLQHCHQLSLLLHKQILIFKMSTHMSLCHQLLVMKMSVKNMHVMESFLTHQTVCRSLVRPPRLKVYGQLLQSGLKRAQGLQSLSQNGWFLEIHTLICTHPILPAFTSIKRRSSILKPALMRALTRHMELCIR